MKVLAANVCHGGLKADLAQRKISQSWRKIRLLGIVVAIAAAVLACPASAQNRLIAEIPIDISFRGVAFVPSRLNSVGPLQFLVDTGGAKTHVAKNIVEQMGLKLERGVASASGDAALEVGVIPSAVVSIGPAECQSMVLASPLAHLEPAFGRSVEGILGSDWMQKYVVELDYTEKVMRIYEPHGFRYDGKGTTLPLTFHQGIPFVDLEVTLPNGKSIRGSFLVDTAGGWMVVHVYKPISDREKLLEALATLPETGLGIGGQTTRVAARGSLLSISGYKLPRPIVKFTDDLAGLRANPNSVGLVGMEVLRRFKVTFDYSRSRLYLEPNRHFPEPFVYDASGLSLRAAPPSFSPPTVARVRESSPAKEAGIAAGDVLVKIDGRSTTDMDLEEVRAALYEAGKTLKLTLLRNGKTLDALLKTREMLP